MDKVSSGAAGKAARPEWQSVLAKYEKPSGWKAAWQLINTFVPYAALWTVMVLMLNHGFSYWLILPLEVVAAGLFVRFFIFFHDCGHGCFLPSRTANRIVGYVTGVLTWTPFDDWKRQHALHHAGSGNLDRRGAGDIWTLTVEEYKAAPLRTKIGYRLFRSPFVLLILGPLYLFIVAHRFPHKGANAKAKWSVVFTNLGIVGLGTAAAFTVGLRTYLLIHLPMVALAGCAGVWLFYVQHQYERTYWAEQADWDPIRAALEGSSYYKLPKLLQWFSGNIGLHHIHHLRAKIPNYNLQACLDRIPEMQKARTITLWSSFKCLTLNLWDERTQNMVPFRALKSRV